MSLLSTVLENKILVITLNDPLSRNAFSPQMADEFYQVLRTTSFSGLIVRANGSCFCSGGNLSFYKKLPTKAEGLKYNKRITHILSHLYELPQPTLALVNGGCYGGGVELLSCFDSVFATPASLFGLWQRRVGLTYGWGGQPRVEQKIGSRKAQSWLLSGSTLSSYQAQEWGLIDQVLLLENLLPCGFDHLNRQLEMGESELQQIKTSKDQNSIFQSLWLEGRHKDVLKKIKS